LSSALDSQKGGLAAPRAMLVSIRILSEPALSEAERLDVIEINW
jgi:hypothetical protein